jgi:hypothetical protein
MMSVILVGQLNGHRQVRWGVAFLVACVLGCFTAAVAAATYFVLSGELSILAAMIGFVGAFITIGAGIRHSYRLPVDKLTPLNASTA